MLQIHSSTLLTNKFGICFEFWTFWHCLAHSVAVVIHSKFVIHWHWDASELTEPVENVNPVQFLLQRLVEVLQYRPSLHKHWLMLDGSYVSWELGSFEQSLAQALAEFIQSYGFEQTLVEQSLDAEFQVQPALHWHLVTSEG